MGLDVTYKGNQIAKLTEDGNLTLETVGKYCEGNIELAYSGEEYHPNVGRYWKPPSEWPDLSSIELPDNDDQNVIYVLYDRSCGYDIVSFYTGGSSDKIYQGTVANGEFIGDLVSSNGGLNDTLLSEYTVYKIVGNGSYLRFYHGVTSGYSVSVQSVVWVYGVAPFITQLGRPQEWGISFGINMVSYELYRTKSLAELYVDIWINSLKKFYIGYTSNGDFNNNPLTRAGNGGMFYQPQDDPDIITIKNISSLGGFSGKFTMCERIAFQNVVGSMYYGMFNYRLKYIAFNDDLLKLTSMYTFFNGFYRLEYCDLSHVDFTDVTSSASCFNGCGSLKTLKLNNTWKMNLPLSQCYALTRDALLDIFDALPETEDPLTISLPYGAKTYLLSETDKEIITTKGWTIA